MKTIIGKKADHCMNKESEQLDYIYFIVNIWKKGKRGRTNSRWKTGER